MNRAMNVREEREVEPAADGFLLLGLLSLQGWEIDITLHDLGVTLVGRRGADEISRIGGSVAQVAVDFFKAAHYVTRVRELRA
ncbi:MAG: hypothetical protein QOD52_205 [Gaiellaceae bacterium]|jgi:hypothetical protein|nr:hypothetical protein [Gaiellaceae bacterium]